MKYWDNPPEKRTKYELPLLALIFAILLDGYLNSEAFGRIIQKLLGN